LISFSLFGNLDIVSEAIATDDFPKCRSDVGFGGDEDLVFTSVLLSLELLVADFDFLSSLLPETDDLLHLHRNLKNFH